MNENEGNKNQENKNQNEPLMAHEPQQIRQPKNKGILFLIVLVVISIALSAFSGFYAWKTSESLKQYKEAFDQLNQKVESYNLSSIQGDVSKMSENLNTLSTDFSDFKRNVNTMLGLDFLTVPGMILLDSDGFQIIDGIFKVSIDSAVSSESGVQITGYILNTDGCTYENIKFTISSYTDILFGPSKTFTISKIDPGHAAKFSVFVSNLGKNIRIVKMYRSSQITFSFYYQ